MPVIDTKNLKPAKRYAKALLGLNCIDETLSGLENISKVLIENPELRSFLEHPIISVSDKKDVIEKVFKESITPDLLSFLCVLLEQSRINILDTILNCLKEEYSTLKGIVQATVKSVIELEDETKERLKKVLEEKLNTRIELDYRLEPSLIGGFSVNIQDKVIDLSVRSKFEQFKKIMASSF